MASLVREVADMTSVDVDGVKARPDKDASESTMQDGIFTNAIGKVTVQDVTTPLPAIILMRSMFPVEVGRVPHDERVGMVPVASQ